MAIDSKVWPHIFFFLFCFWWDGKKRTEEKGGDREKESELLQVNALPLILSFSKSYRTFVNVITTIFYRTCPLSHFMTLSVVYYSLLWYIIYTKNVIFPDFSLSTRWSGVLNEQDFGSNFNWMKTVDFQLFSVPANWKPSSSVFGGCCDISTVNSISNWLKTILRLSR